MTFRRKLLIVFALTVFLSVAAVAGLVSIMTRRAFDKSENDRTAALVTQFQREFERRGNEVERRVETVTASDSVTRMATMLNRSSTDSAGYFELAKSLAEGSQLDFLEFVDAHGNIISSAQWPAKFGYPEIAFDNLAASDRQSAFLKQEDLQDATALGLFAARSSHVGENPVYIVGGRRLDKTFLAGLDLPADSRALLYQNRGDRFSPDLLVEATTTPVANTRPSDKLAALIQAVRQSNQDVTEVIHWSADESDDEVFHTTQLRGNSRERPLLGILLVGNSLRSYVELKRYIRASALLVGGGGILLAIFFSGWAAARVTRPVEQLVLAAQDVAAGNWSAHVTVSGSDEVAQLAESFNRMTTELLNQKERLLQTERVAAWRELARRLAHELKNPLFPLQLTVENLLRAKQSSPEQFEEVFRESSRTLLAEISNLKAIIGRFSDFSKMPLPQLQPVDVNEMLRGVVQLFQAQLQAPARAPIACKLELDNALGSIQADHDLLHRAFSNLVLNAMDAMSGAGTLTLRSRREDGKVVVEIADTGSGMTAEECERIFTPYYTSKQHGTGLGLAIVQSVISDHGGTISVRSQPGSGTTFVIELPRNPDTLRSVRSAASDDHSRNERRPS
jgi:two-component system nitrogen regulation sensor histidine kinase NtrY